MSPISQNNKPSYSRHSRQASQQVSHPNLPIPAEPQPEERQVVIQNTFDLDMINEDSGILVLSLKDIFHQIQEDNEKTYMLTCEYVEIYNDKIFDLLTTQDQLDNQLFINEDSQKKEFYIKGVT